MSMLTSIQIDEPPAGLSIETTLGALYIGSTIAAVHVFYGITILQTVVYYKQNPNDPWLFRYSVAFLWILDTVQVVLSTHVLYFYLIKSFGKYSALLSIIWSVPVTFFLCVITIDDESHLPFSSSCWQMSVFNTFDSRKTYLTITVDAHYLWSSSKTQLLVPKLYAVRIWKLGRHFHMVLPWFIFLAVAATFGTAIYVMYDTYTLTIFTTLEISTIKVSIYAIFSTMAGADFIIAGTMCFYLHKGRSMTSFSSTTKIIKGLMRLVVISGILTSACSLFAVVAYAGWPNTLTFIAIDLVLPKLYINSLLAMLNSRQSSGANGGRRVPQKMIRFAPHDTESGLIDSGQTSTTLPGPSVTEVETDINLKLWSPARYALTPELFSTKDRGTRNGLAVAADRVFGVMAPIIVLYADLTTSVPMFVSGALFLLAGVISLLLPFESRGKAALVTARDTLLAWK
ncbi:hypothetical protein ARMSODRAFT_1021244 [Armillaria solidipes]|uniref:DUF6534 domain-containing protein n=1 Tax=Armillaria solidipes TaxID=1076256 RepID=A0A2H3BQH6_9AGAR|nr:hypothetical protein ARMSODRAFT_1021244 [Armillaria solidipes]